MPNYFDTLDIPFDADDRQVNESYKRKKLEFKHDPDQLALIDQAFAALASPVNRKIYLSRIMDGSGKDIPTSEAHSGSEHQPASSDPGKALSSPGSLSAGKRQRTEIMDLGNQTVSQENPPGSAPSGKRKNRDQTVIMEADSRSGMTGDCPHSINVIVEYHQTIQTFSLHEGENIIGRPPVNGDLPAIPLPDLDSFISRKHAIITRNGGDCSIRDLGSANGTRLNGVRMKPNLLYSFKKGDVVEIEDRKIYIRI